MIHSIEKPGDFERKSKKWLKLAIEYMVKPKTIKLGKSKVLLLTKEETKTPTVSSEHSRGGDKTNYTTFSTNTPSVDTVRLRRTI